MLECPHCGSDQVQRVAVIIDAGTTYGSSGSVSYANGGEATSFVIIGNSNSVQRSQLARRFLNPRPRRPNQDLERLIAIGGVVVGALLILVSISIFLKGGAIKDALPVLFYGVGGVAVGLFVGSEARRNGATGQIRYAKQVQEFEDRQNYLAGAWFCHRCGTDWPGAKSGPSSTTY